MTLLLVSFVVLLLTGLPIAFVLASCCLVWMLFVGDFPLVLIPQRVISGVNAWTFLAVPLFILAGNLMNSAGLTDRLVRFVNSFVGHIRGGLGLANVGTSMVFAGVSGTAVGDAASIGSVMIPAMKQQGYRADYAAAVTAASSVIGPIIPPSVSMVIAATLLNISVGRLFLAGIVPGILLGFGLMGAAWLIAIRQNQPKGERSSWCARGRETVDAIWALLMPLLIVGGIVFGIFTPTEAAGIACVYALIVGKLVYRSLRLRDVPAIMFQSLLTSVPIMVLVGMAATFSWIVIAEHVPEAIVGVLFLISEDPIILLLVINLFLLFVGMFLETNAAILILFPVLFKAAPMLGVDPIHFAIIILLNLMIGLTTPPLGVCLFIAGGISGAKMSNVVRQLVPFLLVSFAVLMAVTYIPFLSLAVPNLFFN